MAETTREMVVRLTMDAGGFKKTASEINRQIRNIDKEIKGMGGDPGKSKLEEKLGLQQKAVENLQKAVEAARAKFNAADTDAQKLLAAKQLSGLETQLTTAEAKAQALKNQLSAANLIKFGTLASNFGKSMQRMGRTMSLYVSGPLMALGGKAYKTALDFESATVSMQKTIDETDTTKYADIEAAFKSLSETTPVGYTELMELAGQAGALGVSADEVIEFVKSVAMISETADDLDASSGANVLARFLNVTDQGSFENITRTASAVTALGNNLATTEGEMLAMAQRMASTGELAGMSNEAILALAAGLTSVGINAEAGGSAAGKLMKKMQLAGETGRRAMQEFSAYSETAGLSPRDLQLAADSSEWVETTAIDLGRTKKEVKDMVASMVALEQFSGVMNVAPAQFIAGWNENAGQSILDFFIGLNEIESSSSEESVLSKLQEMGLTEIRLSNMIAAAAANPDIFKRAMEISNEAYAQNTALAEEAEKRYATAESYQNMQLNKMENAAADAGENVVDIVQPIIEKVSELVGKFSELDEETQTNWVKIAGALILLGPAASGIGSVAQGVGKIATFAGKIKGGEVTLFSKLIGALKGPAGGWLLAAAGVAGVVAALNSIKTPAEQIIDDLKNIVIDLDEESYNTTMAALAEVKAQADALSGETGERNKNISAAVKRGYGTDDMYGTALGYEAMLTQSQIAEIAGKYADRYNELNAAIGAAMTEAEANRIAAERDALKANWDAEVAQSKANYMASVSALVAGMMQSQPEAKAALEQAAQDYDLLVALMDAMDFAAESYDDDAVSKKWAAVFTPDVIEKYFPNAFEILPGRDALSLYETLLANMETALKASGGENSLAYTLWKSILDDPLASGLFDQTKTTGALDGIVELMDFKTAGEKAGMNFGDALTPGLADGIDGAAAPAVDAMDALEAQLVDKAAKMGAAVAAAFNNNVNFRLPNAGGGGVNVNVNSPTAVDIYNIRKGLTDASRRAARGYGAG